MATTEPDEAHSPTSRSFPSPGHPDSEDEEREHEEEEDEVEDEEEDSKESSSEEEEERMQLGQKEYCSQTTFENNRHHWLCGY